MWLPCGNELTSCLTKEQMYCKMNVAGPGWNEGTRRLAGQTACPRPPTPGDRPLSETAHVKARTTLPTRLLTSLRHRPESMNAFRTDFSASGPKSRARG